MCLYSVTKKIENPTDDVVVGWKCFKRVGKEQYTGDLHGSRNTYNTDEWCLANI